MLIERARDKGFRVCFVENCELNVHEIARDRAPEFVRAFLGHDSFDRARFSIYRDSVTGLEDLFMLATGPVKKIGLEGPIEKLWENTAS